MKVHDWKRCVWGSNVDLEAAVHVLTFSNCVPGLQPPLNKFLEKFKHWALSGCHALLRANFRGRSWKRQKFFCYSDQSWSGILKFVVLLIYEYACTYHRKSIIISIFLPSDNFPCESKSTRHEKCMERLKTTLLLLVRLPTSEAFLTAPVANCGRMLWRSPLLWHTLTAKNLSLGFMEREAFLIFFRIGCSGFYGRQSICPFCSWSDAHGLSIVDADDQRKGTYR